MATLKTAIQIHDGMSPAMKTMVKSIQNVNNSFQALQATSRNAVDLENMSAVRSEMARISVAFNDVESNIREADHAQQQFNDQVSRSSGLMNNLKNAALAFGAAIGTRKVLDLADEITTAKTRVGLMNDELQTTAELQQMIFQSAQRSRSSYLENVKAVSKLGILAGDAFKSSEEIVYFAEQMNKQFKIGGAEITEQVSAMHQLTQAMTSGRLQGDEYRAIIENAPLLAKSIEDYMTNVEGATGSMKDWASEGLLTADVIKNAMFESAESTNKAFAELPVTFEQTWTSVKNKAIQAFDPVLAKISSITQNNDFQTLMNNIVGGIVIISSVAAELLNVLASVSGFITNNWSIIEPIILGIAAAMITYTVATKGLLLAQTVGASISGGYAAVQNFLSIGFGILTGNTAAASAAVYTFNSALMASPITWIILAVIALIAVFYAVIGAINKFADTSISATGVIMGVFAATGAHLYNTFVVPTWNAFANLANFFANVFTDPVASIKILFFDMAKTVIGYVLNMANALEKVINKIPGVSIDITSGLDNIYNKLESASIGIKNESEWVEVVGQLDFMQYDKAFNKGYEFGDNLSDKLNFSNLFGSNDLAAFEMGSTLDGIYNGVDNTAVNTASMKDSIDISNEDLKYMRDLAEQQVINRFTTAEIKIEMNNDMKINSEMDLDGVVAHLSEVLEDEINNVSVSGTSLRGDGW